MIIFVLKYRQRNLSKTDTKKSLKKTCKTEKFVYNRKRNQEEICG